MASSTTRMRDSAAFEIEETSTDNGYEVTISKTKCWKYSSVPVGASPPALTGINGSAEGERMNLTLRIFCALLDRQTIYYPILAVFAVPVNLLTIVILSRGKCGLSKCVTRSLVAMAAADLLVVIIDLILKKIPTLYDVWIVVVYYVKVCNFHAVLLYAATDCSVWFTVAFTFDRYVAVSCQKLKTKYCTDRTAAVVLGTVTVLSCLKNTFWYFMFTGRYNPFNLPFLCDTSEAYGSSRVFAAIEFLHHILTPFVPCVLILLLNAFTVRHISVASRVRRRLRGQTIGENASDPEMESRRKSIILLYLISANFILFWAVFLVYSVWRGVWYLGLGSIPPYNFVQELGFMLQLLSCCTNTCIYAVTQNKFREQFKNMMKYPFTLIVKFSN
ncbi:probable G-protein coupled receptor 139 [Heptranchias perlo]|uniref:probable G-protein coupled receptor 139 n=1 Tax=Heptranchias perlo TaxID=212740 RepID=UPI00355AAF5B